MKKNLLLTMLAFLATLIAAFAQTTYTVSNSGFTYNPTSVIAQVNDILRVNASFISHPLAEVNRATWVANQSSPIIGSPITSGATADFPLVAMGPRYFTCTVHAGHKFKVTTCNGTVTTSVAIASDDADNSIAPSTSVTFTATPTNGGDAPSYQWKKNNQNVGADQVTYTDNALVDGDVISCVITGNNDCASNTTATSNEITMAVTQGEATPCGPYTWTSQTSAANNLWRSVIYVNGTFVAVAASGTGNRVMTSPDGLTWTSQTSAADNTWVGVTYGLVNGNSLLVAVGVNAVMTSPDGITWTSQNPAANSNWASVTYGLVNGNPLFVAVSSLGPVMTSPDGITWTSQTAASATWRSVTYGNGLFVAVGTNAVMTSSDGLTWTSQTSAANNNWTSVTYGNNRFVAVASNGTGNGVMTSPDGLTWTSQTSAADNQWQAVAYGSGTFVAVSQSGTGNRVMTSPDGLTWTSQTSAANNSWFGVTYGNGKFVAVSTTGVGNRVMTSIAGPTVSIEVTPSHTIAQGSSVTFTATPTNGGTTPTYVWKKNDVTIDGETGATYTTTTLTNGDKIKVVMTSNASCTSTSNELTMTVTAACAPPTAHSVTGSGSYCTNGNGLPVGLSGSEMGVSYQLSDVNGTVGSPMAGTGSALDFGTKPAGTYTVAATRTDGGCTANMSGSAIVVAITPSTANAGVDKTTCGTTAVALAAVVTAPLSPNLPQTGETPAAVGGWSGGAGTFSNAASPTSTYTPAVGEAGTTVTLTWTVLGTTPCANATDQMTVTVVAPATANAGVDKTTCGTTAVALAAVGTGTWSGGTGSFSNANNPASTYTPAAGESGTTLTLTWTVTGTTPCLNATDQMTVTVNALPTATSAGTTTICQNTASPNISFTGANGTAPYTFTYQINGGGTQTISTTDKNISVNLAVPTNNAGTFAYTLVSVSDANSCSQSQPGTVTVTIHPIHMISLSSATKSPIGCINTALSPITFALSGGAMGANVSGLPAGVNGSVTNGVLTISGTPSVSGVFNYSIITTGNECATASESGTITINTKPTITLSVNGQTLNEGNNPTLCDTDANPVNSLQFTVYSSCVAGSPVWRVQVGSGAWSSWSNQAPLSQPSDNQLYKYQAACDVACPSTQSGIISPTINYRAATPQNVSLVADGITVAAGESKMICNNEGNALTFHATCGAGEILLYSVDGSEYSAVAPSQIVDNNFHNYRVRCRKSDGTLSCVETESAVMSLKITTAPAAPTISIIPMNNCGAPAVFSGNATCGTLNTIWYNAATNQALPTLPSTTPTTTTSYYARCQNEAGCEGEKSNVVTFTLSAVGEAPLVTVSAELVCAGTEVTVSTTCPTGASVLWNTGVTEASFKVAFSNVTKASYTARCVFAGGCQSLASAAKTVYWKGFELTFINVGQSGSATKSDSKAAWSSQFITPDAGPNLDYSTEANPTIYYSENVNKTAPRFWTIHAETCNLGTDGSLTFNMLATPELGVIRSYNTHENNAPYFMYANRAGFTELYAQNHPAYGFFADNGSGGNVYDEGLPKGLYKLGVRYWDQKGQGSIYPSTRQPAGNVLAYQEYWFRIQSKNGVGVGAARTALNNDQSSMDNAQWAAVAPNPVSSVMRLKVNEAKGQKVTINLLDATGRTMLQEAFVPETNQHQEELGVSHLANGMYFLRVTTADKHATLKVLKVE